MRPNEANEGDEGSAEANEASADAYANEDNALTSLSLSPSHP